MSITYQTKANTISTAVLKRLNKAKGTESVLKFIDEKHPDIAGILTNFCALAGIPRPSTMEGEVSRFIIEIAEEKGWTYKKDAVGNLAVSVPGKGTGVNAETVCLQGHLDMVTVPVSFDFLNTPLTLKIEKGEFEGSATDILKADQTTLGADNGIGVATSINVALNQPENCPPLVLLFTMDEETGLTGAMQLDKSLLQNAKYLVNLDSEDHGTITISCAGGKMAEGKIIRDKINAPTDFVPIQAGIKELAGGHSGLEIHEKRGNAIIILAKALKNALSEQEFYLSTFDGGDKRNAIPAWASANLFVEAAKADETIENVKIALENQVKADVDSEFNSKSIIEITKTDSNEKVFSSEFSKDFVAAFSEIQNGVLSKYEEEPFIVATSSNLGVVRTEANTISFLDNMRTSEKNGFEKVEAKLLPPLKTLGFDIVLGVPYPGWSPDTQSHLLKTAKATYRDLFSKEVETVAVHAGLECGVIKTEEMQAISFGPQINCAHSPDEHLVLETVEPFDKFLRTLLVNLCK